MGTTEEYLDRLISESKTIGEVMTKVDFNKFHDATSIYYYIKSKLKNEYN